MPRVSSPPSPFRPLRRSFRLPQRSPSPPSLRASCSVALSPSSPIPLRRYVATSLRRFLHSASNVTLRKNCTSQTKPFASPTSIPVLRPAPYAFVKPGRAGKPGRKRGCHGQAKRRHALRAGTHAGAFGLGMAPTLCLSSCLVHAHSFMLPHRSHSVVRMR